MIVVLHRERSEKLAREFVAALHEERADMESWADMDQADQEHVVRGFDALIQDGLIGLEQSRQQGRE